MSCYRGSIHAKGSDRENQHLLLVGHFYPNFSTGPHHARSVADHLAEVARRLNSCFLDRSYLHAQKIRIIGEGGKVKKALQDEIPLLEESRA